MPVPLFTLHWIAFRGFIAAAKSHPVKYQLLSDVTLHLRDRRGTASLRYRNRVELIVVVCEQ